MNTQHHSGALGKQPLVVGQLGTRTHVLEVMACAKGFAFGSDHHRACSGILRNEIKRRLQGGQHVFTQGVKTARAVQGEVVDSLVIAGVK